MASGPVVFEGSVLQAPHTGVALSFLSTLRAYAALAKAEGSCLPVLLLPPGCEPPSIDGLSYRTGPRGAVNKQLRLRGLLQRLDATLLHSPVALVPLRVGYPSIATVHDVPWHPEAGLTGERGEPGLSWRHRWAVRSAMRHAAAVLVPSATTKRQLLDVSTGSGDKVEVVAHGVELPTEPACDAELSGPFLVLGDNRPRKNLAAVRDAHARAKTMHANLPDLLLVGPGQPGGYVSEARKIELLRTSRALLQLSRFEGYGLPVLEGFAHGVPVVCSNRGSLAEVAGDAALLVDPDDIDAMATAMVRVHTDVALRQQLRQRGLARVAERTPEQAAAGWWRLHARIQNGTGACTSL